MQTFSYFWFFFNTKHGLLRQLVFNTEWQKENLFRCDYVKFYNYWACAWNVSLNESLLGLIFGGLCEIFLYLGLIFIYLFRISIFFP